MVDMDTIMREALECVETDDLLSLHDEADYNEEKYEAYTGIDEVIGGNDEFGHFMKVVDFFDTRETRTGYRVNGDADNIDQASEHYDNIVAKYEDSITTLVELYQRKLAGLDTRWNNQLRRGKLDTRRLSRYGQSRNLFKKRNVQDDPTANVIILVDASGSMGGHSKNVYTKGTSAAHHAANASIIFHEVFHRLGFNCEVVDFSSEYDYGTQGGTQIAINKLYNTPLNNRTKAAIALPSTGAENSDGRAVNWCYNRLAEMPSDVAANMVFTISDGSPAGPSPSGRSVSEDLSIVAANPPRGVELFALGICGSPVHQYYEHHLSVKNLTDITDKGLHLIEDMLDRVRRNRVVQ
jgi:cobalamin biosynthesis protein CobT